MKKTLALIIGLCLLSVLAQAAPDGVNQNLSVNSAAELADIFTGGLSSYYDELEDGDICWVISPATLSWRLYIYDSDSAQTEDGERYVTPDETSTGNAYSGDARWVCMSTMQAGSDGDFFAELSNNTAIDPDASKYQMYFDNGEFKVNENGTEKTVANLTDAQTFAGAQTMTGGIASIGAASNLSGGIVTLGTLGGTIVVPTGATLAASGSGAITATALAASTTLTTPNIGAATGTSLALGADPADAGALRLSNATAIVWEDATEASITHVDNTGWLINAAHVFRFRDSAISIGSADDGHLDLTADTSIDLNGAVVATGTVGVATSLNPDASDGATLGTTALEWSDLYLADGGVIYGQADQSNTLTSSATGWTMNLDLTVTGNDIMLGADGSGGVKISSDGDGAITFLGAGAGADESLIINLDDTTDSIVVSSGSGATQIDFSALNLVTTGAIHGGIEIIADDTSLSAAQCYGSVNNTNGAETITLPAAVVGMNVLIYSNDATVKNVDPNGTDTIILTTAALTAGYQIKSPGAAGDFIALVCMTANQWTCMGRSGTWVTHGAD